MRTGDLITIKSTKIRLIANHELVAEPSPKGVLYEDVKPKK